MNAYFSGSKRPDLVPRAGPLTQTGQPATGIYLPKKIHDRVHNFQHYAWIYDTFNRYRALGNNGNCNYASARNAMAYIKRTMTTGTFPGSRGSG